MYICLYECIRMYVCVYVNVYVCMYICMYVCMYVRVTQCSNLLLNLMLYNDGRVNLINEKATIKILRYDEHHAIDCNVMQ